MDKLEKVVRLFKQDFPLYARECLKIKTKSGDLIPFELNKAQLHVWNIILSCLLNKQPIRIYVLKSRQMGFSTLFQGLATWFTTLNKNRDAIVIAHDTKAVQNMFEKQDDFYKNLPALVKPQQAISNRKEMHFAAKRSEDGPGLNSKITTQTAENADIGRSFTFQMAHLSEFGFWESYGYDPLVRLSALNNAIPELPATFLFIETTANGEGIAKEMWDDNTNGYIKVFVSWVADDNYRLELDRTNYKFDLSRKDNHLYGNEVDEYQLVESEVKKWYKLDGKELEYEVYCRLAWRRKTIEQKCNKKLNTFRQEYPTSPEQAFIASGSNIYNQEIMEAMKATAKKGYNFDFNFDKLPQYKEYKEVRLVKETVKDLFVQDDYGALQVFEPPKPDCNYVFGVDTSEGLTESDFQAIVVLKVPELIEVATFNDRISPDKFALIVCCLALIYNNAFVVVEDNDRGGFLVIKLLDEKYKYRNLYRRTKLSGNKDFTEKKEIGWKTTVTSKPFMVQDLEAIINEMGIKFNSLQTINQLKKFSKLADGDLGVPRPGFDDLCIAAMLAYQGSKGKYFSRPKREKNGKLTYQNFIDLLKPEKAQDYYI